ncbi:BTAD domain-containing putative transcriptional regulator [Streptomyces sp. NPDC002785]|uniref:BTAD domain-containing putative transcriptional regulator n=1 Tax=Streptomyces sp. NPDC002785 TaxID=3154543 RepID=UPI003328642E
MTGRTLRALSRTYRGIGRRGDGERRRPETAFCARTEAAGQACCAEGRQADAIQVRHRAKKILREQTGVTPGARMTKVMQAILRQDERLLQVGPPEMR